MTLLQLRLSHKGYVFIGADNYVQGTCVWDYVRHYTQVGSSLGTHWHVSSGQTDTHTDINAHRYLSGTQRFLEKQRI